MVNIPDGDVSKGQQLLPFQATRGGVGPQRHVVLLFIQPKALEVRRGFTKQPQVESFLHMQRTPRLSTVMREVPPSVYVAWVALEACQCSRIPRNTS